MEVIMAKTLRLTLLLGLNVLLALSVSPNSAIAGERCENCFVADCSGEIRHAFINLICEEDEGVLSGQYTNPHIGAIGGTCQEGLNHDACGGGGT